MNDNILVITNNFQSSLAYTQMLVGYGFTVDEVKTIKSAKVHMDDALPFVVVMDMKNHINDQINFVEFLSKQHHNTRVIHVGIDNLETDHDIIHMQRPVQPESILNTINQIS